MKDCYEFYVTDQEISFNVIFKCVCDFLQKESLSNKYFNNIKFVILGCKNALLIQFSYVDTKRDNILNIRIFKNPIYRYDIHGTKRKVFDLIFGLLRESVDKYERSKKFACETIKKNLFYFDPEISEKIAKEGALSKEQINDLFNQMVSMGSPIKWR